MLALQGPANGPFRASMRKPLVNAALKLHLERQLWSAANDSIWPTTDQTRDNLMVCRS
jgi:hypothetical protein